MYSSVSRITDRIRESDPIVLALGARIVVPSILDFTGFWIKSRVVVIDSDWPFVCTKSLCIRQ